MLSTNKISRLTTSTSYQLEAEQVIPDLSSALKELVENALDSNPSTISKRLFIKFISYKVLAITFVNHGFDSIIVEDDGDGIQSEDMSEIGTTTFRSIIIYKLIIFSIKSIRNF